MTALEAALGIRPTWYNGGGETFGPGGSVIAAMLAVAGGLARHVLCFRTLWEATYGELVRRGTIRADTGPVAGWMRPFGATSAAHTLAQNAQRHFHRYGTTARDAGLDRAEPAGQRRCQPDGDLPRSAHHGRVPDGQAHYHPVRTI